MLTASVIALLNWDSVFDSFPKTILSATTKAILVYSFIENFRFLLYVKCILTFYITTNLTLHEKDTTRRKKKNLMIKRN